MSFGLRQLTPLARRLRGAEMQQQAQSLRRMAADAHGDHKVNAWEAPGEIAKWKEEHIVFLVLGSWGAVIYGSMKIFGGGKKELASPEVAAAAAAPPPKQDKKH